METTQQKLDRLNALGTQLTQWEQGFSESVTDQYKQCGRLSGAQISTIDNILAKHDPAVVKARNTWRG